MKTGIKKFKIESVVSPSSSHLTSDFELSLVGTRKNECSFNQSLRTAHKCRHGDDGGGGSSTSVTSTTEGDQGVITDVTSRLFSQIF